jgi:hypothetical protein
VVEFSKGVIGLNAIPLSSVDNEIVLTPNAESTVPIKLGEPVFCDDRRVVVNE